MDICGDEDEVLWLEGIHDENIEMEKSDGILFPATDYRQWLINFIYDKKLHKRRVINNTRHRRRRVSITTPKNDPKVVNIIDKDKLDNYDKE